MKRATPRPESAVYVVALLAVVIWGGTPVATKIALVDLSPLAVALLRTLLGGLAALVLALALRLPLPESAEKRWLLALSAACGFIGFPLLLSVGVQRTTANHASIILASLPVFTAAIALAWDRQRPRRAWWLGVGVALLGEAVLVSGRDVSGDATASLSGDLLVLGGNLFASLGYVAGGRLHQAGYGSVATTFWGAGLAALVLLPVAPLLISGAALTEASSGTWVGVLYLAVGATIVAYVMWYWALGRGGIARLGLMQFLQPVSGVILAWILLGERFGPSFLVAAGLVLAGVWIAIRARP